VTTPYRVPPTKHIVWWISPSNELIKLSEIASLCCPVVREKDKHPWMLTLKSGTEIFLTNNQATDLRQLLLETS
jgi:hypothetical protein